MIIRQICMIVGLIVIFYLGLETFMAFMGFLLDLRYHWLERRRAQEAAKEQTFILDTGADSEVDMSDHQPERPVLTKKTRKRKKK